MRKSSEKSKKVINTVEAVARICSYFDFEYKFGNDKDIVVLRHKTELAELLLDWADSSATLRVFDKDSNPFSEKDSYLMCITLVDLGFKERSMFFGGELDGDDDEDGENDCPGCENCMPDFDDEKMATPSPKTIQ